MSGGGDVYTMAEAARLKGVSYHTVSRAVRRGKLPATRLGRMALIASEDLRDWRPMRERAPRKYRRREPNPEATPALLDLASAERVELASRLASLYETLHAAATGAPHEEMYDLLAERLAGSLGMRRVAIRLIDRQRGRTVRVGAYGAPLTNLPNEMSVESAPFVDEISRAPRALVEDLTDRNLPETASTPITSLLVAPIRIDDRSVGVIVADRSGEPFGLTQGELDLAQAMANVAALAVASAAAHPFANAA
jgi:excisionase family DNA binding protein